MNNNVNDRLIFKGKEINTKTTIDGGALYGCTIADGGDVTILDASSVVDSCKVVKGGKLDVKAGLITDLIVEAGGKLTIGKNVVHYGVYVKGGADLWIESDTNGVIIDDGTVVHRSDDDRRKQPETDKMDLFDDYEDSDDACDHCCDKCHHHVPEANKGKSDRVLDENLDRALKDDAESSQFNGVTPADRNKTQEELDADHEEELHNTLVDHHNRTRLVIRAKCNYDCVIESISFFMFQYEEHTFTLYPELSDEVFETDDENDVIRIYIKHLPRMDVDDYDLVLRDIVFDGDTPKDLRFGIIEAEYEDKEVNIDLSPSHDEHLYEIEDEPTDDDINDCNSTIVLRGELCGRCVNSWSNGDLVIARGDEKYHVHEKEGSRQASISISDLSFKMTIHPAELKGFDGEIVTGDDVYPILHHSTMIGWENAEPDALLRFNSYEADGLSLPVKIPAQDLTVAIDGYSEDKVNIFSAIKVRRYNESFEECTIVDKDDERLIYYDSDTHYFRIIIYPRFVLDKNNKKIVGDDMVKLVKDCHLTGFVPMHDIGDACIEISTFSVNGVLHAISLLNENSRRFKVFKYHKVTKETEKDACDPAEPVFTKTSVVPDNKNQSIIDPKLRVLKLAGKYKYFLPQLQINLVIEDDNGSERFELWAGSIDRDFDENTDDVTITFKDIMFVRGDRRIYTPLALIDRKYSFEVKPFKTQAGEFFPLYLVWGSQLHYDFRNN